MQNIYAFFYCYFILFFLINENFLKYFNFILESVQNFIYCYNYMKVMLNDFRITAQENTMEKKISVKFESTIRLVVEINLNCL